MATDTVVAPRPVPASRRPRPVAPGPVGLPQPSPAALAVVAYQQGRPDAFDCLLALFGPMMSSVARRYLRCPQDVEDAVQDAWVAFARAAHRIETPAAVGAWLCTTTARAALAIARGQARCRPTESGLERPVAAMDATRLERGDDVRAVREAVGRLSGTEQDLVKLLFEQELAYTDIAASTGRAVGGIGPTRQRIIGKLRHDRAIRSCAR